MALTQDKRVRIITGHYGSGKTEFAVNLALAMADAGMKTALGDLDIVNPYFRSRERQALMEDRGIRVIVSSCGGHVDLPAINAEVLTILEDKTYQGVLDIGGDAEGARVLARFCEYLARTDFDLFCVINANRPETRTPERAVAYLRDIEATSLQKVTGLINNTHLCRETRPEDIIKGYGLAKEVERQTGIPLRYNGVERRFLEDVRYRLEGEILPMDIWMKKPWETEIN